jgi:hypothetical protein
MGLDQYLRARVYDRKINVELGLEQSMIVYQLAYWRKANQIHAWFVENVQNGEDDCGQYIVLVEQLKQLLAVCRDVKSGYAPAEKILPTRQGFFFGSQDYDEWYMRDINSTIAALEKTIKLMEGPWKDKSVEIYYSSSW